MNADGNEPHNHAADAAAAKDCGCGCGGSGDCGDAGKSKTSLRQGRRKFLVGGIGVGAFAATLASRPAFAACQNLTGLYSPTGSQTPTNCGGGGKTPGFWM